LVTAKSKELAVAAATVLLEFPLSQNTRTRSSATLGGFYLWILQNWVNG
jgi:hypothetical protein